MSYSYRPRYGFGGMLTPAVKSLLIINVMIYLLEYITGQTEMLFLLGLVPRLIIQKFFIWQFFTYMFLHGGFGHLFLNMFVLWMFGSEIERYWGSRDFLKYYFITGVGAGILSWLTAYNSPYPTIGASGAVYGILVAYGLMFPDRPIYIYFLLPIRAKHFVIFLAIMELFASRGYASSSIAHFAHLGGMLFGYLYLKRERLRYLLGDLFRGGRARRDAQKQMREQQERDLERQVDEILQKISREGMGSLTSQEKELLERSSRRFRFH